jgi:CBS domain-containing protein
MSAPAVSLPATLTVAEAVETGFAHHLFSAFPVIDGEGRAIGIVTMGDVRALPGPQRAVTVLGALAHRDPELLIEPSHSASALVADPAFRRLGRAVVVDPAGHPAGLVSVTDIDRRLRAEGLLSGIARPRRAA